MSLSGLCGALLTLATLACATPARAVEASVAFGTCPITLPNETLRCGTLTVPETREPGKNARTIRTSFIVIPASDPAAKESDPILFLTGGPGFSALLAAKDSAQFPLRRTRDIVLLEQRGNGYAEPALLCPGTEIEQLRACYGALQKAGIDLGAFNTTESIGDAEDLRRLLQVRQWNLLGISYGTLWALHYARLHPESIRSMILDSPVPAQANYDSSVGSALNSFSRMFDACKNDPACARAYPDLRQRFIDTVRRLNERPVPLGKHAIDGGRFFAEIYETLYYTSSISKVPRAIDLAARGALEQSLGAGGAGLPSVPDGFDPKRIYAIGLYQSVECADDALFPSTPDVQIQPTETWPEDLLRSAQVEGWNIKERCAAWPVRRSDPVLAAPVVSSIPTLILAGGFDPITPEQFGRAAQRTLSKASLVVVPSAAHIVVSLPDPCVHGIVGAFIAKPDAPVDASCVASIPPRRFEIVPPGR